MASKLLIHPRSSAVNLLDFPQHSPQLSTPLLETLFPWTRWHHSLLAVLLPLLHSFVASCSDCCLPDSEMWQLPRAVLESLVFQLYAFAQSDLMHSHCFKYHTSNSQIYNFGPDLFSDTRLINLITHCHHQGWLIGMWNLPCLQLASWSPGNGPSIHTTGPWGIILNTPSPIAYPSLHLLSSRAHCLSLDLWFSLPSPCHCLTPVPAHPFSSNHQRELFKPQIWSCDSLFGLKTLQRFTLRIYNKVYDLGKRWYKLDENFFLFHWCRALWMLTYVCPCVTPTLNEISNISSTPGNSCLCSVPTLSWGNHSSGLYYSEWVSSVLEHHINWLIEMNTFLTKPNSSNAPAN